MCVTNKCFEFEFEFEDKSIKRGAGVGVLVQVCGAGLPAQLLKSFLHVLVASDSAAAGQGRVCFSKEWTVHPGNAIDLNGRRTLTIYPGSLAAKQERPYPAGNPTSRVLLYPSSCVPNLSSPSSPFTSTHPSRSSRLPPPSNFPSFGIYFHGSAGGCR